jgi:hypothetical protein
MPKSVWFNLPDFLWMLTAYRVVYIRGRYGSGKTLLSVALSYELWKQQHVDRIYSNFPMAGRDENYEYSERFAMILDEAHIVLDSRSFSRQASQTWLRDLRKRESVLIMPAVLSVDIRFRSLSVQRIFMFGNLLWVYRYEIDDGARLQNNTFSLLFPNYYFGAYSTKYSPKDEDFDNLKKVMAGMSTNKNTLTNEDEKENYRGVQTVSYMGDDAPKFSKLVKNPKFNLFD